ncbi:peroxidase superfamily protein [Artemisia annua]|uniref:Peroxidase n=1 Tax=Artemisia annua TaxID=35608 RepID=A0A2U1LJB8_ARTAN|nr:peroxidase superfamily protein [Artemisia annua]
MRGFWSFGITVLGFISILGSVQGDLQTGFYSSSCPKAEKIIKDYVNQHIPNAPSLAATLIRMHFHDCFVRGCDASILLNFTSASGNQTEKVATPNQTVRGFDFIDRIKSLLEAECPSIVSSADIISLAARDSIVVTGGPFWKVPTGRRDGLFSNASEALAQIPAPFDNITILTQKFANKSLNLKDLVLLSGGFFVKSVRNLVDGSLISSDMLLTRWVKVVPIKINLFAWKVQNDKLLTRLNLSWLGIDIHSIMYPICEEEAESLAHLLFSCSIARKVLSKARRWLGVSSQDFQSYEEWLLWFSDLRMRMQVKNMQEGVFM